MLRQRRVETKEEKIERQRSKRMERNKEKIERQRSKRGVRNWKKTQKEKDMEGAWRSIMERLAKMIVFVVLLVVVFVMIGTISKGNVTNFEVTKKVLNNLFYNTYDYHAKILLQ